MCAAHDKILIVDSDLQARESLLTVLRTAGVECHAAANVRRGVGLLQQEAFDVVIIDPTQFPGEVQGFARAVDESGSLLLCAGRDGAVDDLRWALSIGARGVVNKPWAAAADVIEQIRSIPLAAHDRNVVSDDVRVLRARCESLRQRVEEQGRVLEQSQESYNLDVSRMMTIVGNIMDGIVFTDAASVITLMNPVAEDLLDVKSFMAIGKRLDDLSGRTELVAAIREEHARLRDWRESSRVVEVHHTEQDLLYIKVLTSRVVDYRGKFAGTLTVLQNVTAEYKTDQLKNQYLSIVAHELRTPLTGIKTFSTMMSKGVLGPLNDKQARVVESIREQSLRLEHQIDKLINLGHIESNEFGQDLEVLDVCELIRHATAPFEQAAKDRQIVMTIDLPGDAQVVRGDRADLRRAVQALVENAVKFTGDGGRVLVQVLDDDDSVRVIVRDSGVGIDPRYHRRIFEKFFQVEDPLTRHHGGSGLGLFFVHGIVTAHGSKVDVNSSLGFGSEFSFSLPKFVADAENTALVGSSTAASSLSSEV